MEHKAFLARMEPIKAKQEAEYEKLSSDAAKRGLQGLEIDESIVVSETQRAAAAREELFTTISERKAAEKAKTLAKGSAAAEEYLEVKIEAESRAREVERTALDMAALAYQRAGSKRRQQEWQADVAQGRMKID